ncbi:glycosyltransferase [Dermacoccus sp. NHGro5]|nr:glycosyltransferase [Dermacoccus sp. NHGro5]
MKTLLIDLLPYEHSTRTRKLGERLAAAGAICEAITLSQVGRVGIAGSQNDAVVDGVAVRKIATPTPAQGASTRTAIINLVRTYPKAIATLAWRAIRTPADAIVVGHMSLFWIGLAHHKRHGSKVLLNGRERPGGINTKGSLGTAFSRVEPAVLRRLSGIRDLAVVAVCDGHADDFRALGLETLVARNAPAAAFRSDFVPTPDEDVVRVACVGSLYEGRGIELLIKATDAAQAAGAQVVLEVTGRGGAEYVTALKNLAASCRHSDAIVFHGPCAPEEVPAAYHRVHVGTALYEAVDAANDSLSNKIFESVVSGRPVLAGNLSENRRFVREHRLGWVTDVTSEGLTNALLDIYARRAQLPGLAVAVHETSRAFSWETESAPVVAWVLGSSHLTDDEMETK